MRKLFLLLLVATSCAFGYVRSQTAGSFDHRTDNTAIPMLLNANALPGLTSANGNVWISADSDVLSAVSGAFRAWSSIPTASIQFQALQTTEFSAGTAGKNIIAFEDTPENRLLLGSALAVTTRFVLTNGSGSITKTDILFSPGTDSKPLQFSTSLAAGSYDLQAVLTHELGHALGANHSGVLSATMFQASSQKNLNQATLSQDDLSFATETYPRSGGYGALAGALQDSAGSALRGALITAQDPNSGVIVGGFSSLTDGSFSMVLPPGSYQVWAEPLSGQVQPANLYLPAGVAIDTNFQAQAAASVVEVVAGATAQTAITAPTGVSPIKVTFSAALPATQLLTGPALLTSGGDVVFQFQATGLDTTLAESDLSFVGPVSKVSGSFLPLSGTQFRLRLHVPPVSKPTSASMLIHFNGNAAVFSGGLLILPPAPSFPADGVANVFSYAAGSVAPGEIVAIFGTNLGPPGGVAGGLDANGRLATRASGFGVTFDGIRAPVFFASSGQMNVEVPYELAGRTSASIVVSNGTSISAPVTVAVSPAQPGLFPAAVNPNGSLNSALNPAPAGEYVVLYATGLGTLPGVETGVPVGGAAGAEGTAVSIDGGVPVIPSYAGAAPYFTGLDQINLTGLAPGQHSVVVSVSGQNSQPITVWMR